MTAIRTVTQTKGDSTMKKTFSERESWHLGIAFVVGFAVLSILAVMGF
jgi:hypothetical protein